MRLGGRAIAGGTREIAEAGVRYGYRRIHVLLRREGWPVNARRVHRLYRLEGLVGAGETWEAGCQRD